MARLTSPSSPSVSQDRLLTAAETAELLRVSLDQVYRLDLPKIRIGKIRARYLESEVWAWVKGRAA
jgi:predicted DNA-binding transcriptional regulator AlpA